MDLQVSNTGPQAMTTEDDPITQDDTTSQDDIPTQEETSILLQNILPPEIPAALNTD